MSGHGTDAGYQAHIGFRTPPCGPCRDAHARAEHARRHGVTEMEARLRALEAERRRPVPELDPLTESFRRLLDLIAGECRRAGYLPRGSRGRA